MRALYASRPPKVRTPEHGAPPIARLGATAIPPLRCLHLKGHASSPVARPFIAVVPALTDAERETPRVPERDRSPGREFAILTCMDARIDRAKIASLGERETITMIAEDPRWDSERTSR
jgi:hypothetical protein